jgi:OmpA-OmpF porin, OOP family
MSRQLGEIVGIRFAMLLAAALSLTLTISDARAITQCPAHSQGVPGPFYVLFAVGSTQIDAPGMEKIRAAAKLAKDLYIRKVCVRGKADKQGNADYNLTLSVKRAEAVANALIKQGVDASTVLVVGKGEGYGDSINIFDDSQIDRSAKISLTK